MIDWLIVGWLTFSAKYFLHIQDENKLTNTYMNYTKIRGEWDNQLNRYRLPLEMHSALNMGDQNSLL